MAIPRHALNFLTGTVGSAYLVYRWWCSPFMRVVSMCVLLTTVIYHGAHTLGHERWANEKFMRVDVSAVVLGGIALLWITPPAAQREVCIILGLSLAIWLPTFGPLKGITFNPLLSVCHGLGVVGHLHAIAHVCEGS